MEEQVAPCLNMQVIVGQIFSQLLGFMGWNKTKQYTKSTWGLNSLSHRFVSYTLLSPIVPINHENNSLFFSIICFYELQCSIDFSLNIYLILAFLKKCDISNCDRCNIFFCLFGSHIQQYTRTILGSSLRIIPGSIQ